MQIDAIKLASAATRIRCHPSTIQVTPDTAWLAEYAWSSFSELAYGPTKEAAEYRSMQRLHSTIQIVASRIETIAVDGGK